MEPKRKADQGLQSQTGSQNPFDVIRKFIPFTHGFRANQKDGRGQQIQVAFANANVDQVIKLSLGHTPGQYVQTASSTGGVVYNGSNQGNDWTPTQIVLRATVAGGYRLLVI